MKNNYALNSQNEIVHVREIAKGDSQHYFCCNCGDRMIPKKGNIKVHHFAHKTVTCSFETYLHKLAKLKFFLSYSKCLEENTPFTLHYFVNMECTSCQDKLNINCAFKNEFRLYDLTKTFDKITIEKGINGFIADVLLESSISTEKILIEFAVKHYSSVEKTQSGLKIVEIGINEESDLDHIENNSIRFDKFNLKLHNFKTKNTRGNLINPNECKNNFFFFTVNPEGKALLRSTQMRQILSDLEFYEFLYYKIIEIDPDFYEHLKFIELVKECSLKGIKVTNCHACRFIKLNTRRGKEYPWFCAKHKAEIENSNHACDKMWRISLNLLPTAAILYRHNDNRNIK